MAETSAARHKRAYITEEKCPAGYKEVPDSFSPIRWIALGVILKYDHGDDYTESFDVGPSELVWCGSPGTPNRECYWEVRNGYNAGKSGEWVGIDTKSVTRSGTAGESGRYTMKFKTQGGQRHAGGNGFWTTSFKHPDYATKGQTCCYVKAECVAYGGECVGGTLITEQSLRTQDNHCASCNNDFYLKDRACKACKNCGTGEYEKHACSSEKESDTVCATCDNMDCPAGQYRDGKCSGGNNGYECKTCDRQNCDATQFRTGSCSGTKNDYQCITITCDKGTPAQAAQATSTHHCAACDLGYTLASDIDGTSNICVLAQCTKGITHTWRTSAPGQNTYALDAGVAEDGTRRQDCEKCERGYYLFTEAPGKTAYICKKKTSEAGGCPADQTHAVHMEDTATYTNHADVNGKTREYGQGARDDTYCRPMCGLGEGYATLLPRKYPHKEDTCVRCERNTYQDRSGHHTPCKACTGDAKFTADTGTESANQCVKSAIEVFASTHRIWYRFQELVLQSASCMETVITKQGSEAAKGVPAVRDATTSPLCEPVVGSVALQGQCTSPDQCTECCDTQNKKCATCATDAKILGLDTNDKTTAIPGTFNDVLATYRASTEASMVWDKHPLDVSDTGGKYLCAGQRTRTDPPPAPPPPPLFFLSLLHPDISGLLLSNRRMSPEAGDPPPSPHTQHGHPRKQIAQHPCVFADMACLLLCLSAPPNSRTHTHATPCPPTPVRSCPAKTTPAPQLGRQRPFQANPATDSFPWACCLDRRRTPCSLRMTKIV